MPPKNTQLKCVGRCEGRKIRAEYRMSGNLKVSDLGQSHRRQRVARVGTDYETRSGINSQNRSRPSEISSIMPKSFTLSPQIPFNLASKSISGDLRWGATG